jgi:hypothetical protein
MIMYAFWPTPTGLGAALMKANVGMFHAGVCALAFGTSRVEAPIEIVKNIAIAIAVVLFLVKFMYFSSFFLCLHDTLKNVYLFARSASSDEF